MARGTILQRIALEGVDAILNQLRDLGRASEQAFAKVKASADKAVVPDKISNSADKAKKSLTDLGKSAEGIKKAEQAFTAFGGVVQKALGGSTEAANVFRLLGVDLRDAALNAKPIGQVLAEVAERLRVTADSGFKTGLAFKLFGAQTAAVLPTLNKGKIGVDELSRAITGIPASGATGAVSALELGVVALGAAVVGVGAGVVVAVGALQRLASAGADAASKIQKAADAAGLSTDKYQQLAGLADKAGISQEGLVGGLSKLDEALRKNKEAHDQRTASQKAADTIAESLGIKIQRMGTDASKTSEDLFGLGVNVLGFGNKAKDAAKTGDEFDKTLVKLLGKKGADDFLKLDEPIARVKALSDAIRALGAQEQLDVAKKLGVSEMLPLLRLGSTGIQELIDKEKEQNRQLTENEIKVGTDLKTAYTNFGDAVDSAKDKLGLIFAPSFTQAANAAADAIDRNRASLLEWGNALNKTATVGIPAFITEIERVGTAFSGMATGASADMDTFLAIFKKLGTGDLFGAISEIDKAVHDAFQGADEAAAASDAGQGFPSIQGNFDDLVIRWNRTIETIAKTPLGVDFSDVSERWARVQQTILDDWNKGLDQWKELGRKTAEAFASGFDVIKGLVRSAGDSLFDALFKDFQDIPARIDRVKDNVGKAFNELFGIGSAKAADGPTGSPFASLEADSTAIFDRIKQAATDTVAAVNAIFSGATVGVSDAAGAASDAGNGVAPVASGAFSSIITQATDAFAQLQTLATDTVAAIRDGFTNLSVDWTPFSTGADAVWQSLKDKATETAEFIKAQFAGIKVDWTGLLNGLQDAINAILAPIQQIGAAVTDAASVVASAASQMVSSFNQVADAARAAASAAASIGSGGSGGGSDVGGFATGGHVRGRGTSTSDSILSWLSNNEFVIQARAVRRYGLDFLHAVNSGRFKLPGYAKGGSVAPQYKLGLPAFSLGGFAGAISASMRNLAMPMSRMPRIASAGTASIGRPLTLHIGNEPVSGLFASEPAVQQIMKIAARRKRVSTGRSPMWEGS